MSVQATSWAWEQRVEPIGAKMVLLALADFADERGYCWPGQKTLGAMTGLSERAVRDNLQVLFDRGLIREGERPPVQTRGAPAAYYLCAPRDRLSYRAMRGAHGAGGAAGGADQPAESAGRSPDDGAAVPPRDGGNDRQPLPVDRPNNRQPLPVDPGNDRQPGADQPADRAGSTGRSGQDSKEESDSESESINRPNVSVRSGDGSERQAPGLTSVDPGVPPEQIERWRQARNQLRERLGGGVFAAYIAGLHLVEAGPGGWRIAARSEFVADYVRQTFERDLQRALGGKITIIVRSENGRGHDPASA